MDIPRIRQSKHHLKSAVADKDHNRNLSFRWEATTQVICVSGICMTCMAQRSKKLIALMAPFGCFSAACLMYYHLTKEAAVVV